MDRLEYMQINSKYLSPEIQKLYNIDYIISDDGYVYVEINKGMHGLKQSVIIVYAQ